MKDTFTDVAGTLLTAHTADTGETYTRWAGLGSTVVITDEGRVRGNGTAQLSIHYTNYASPPTDLSLYADLHQKSVIDMTQGLVGRFDLVSLNHCFFHYSGQTGAWELYQFLSSVQTKLDSAVVSFPNGPIGRMQLKFDGAAVSGLLDGAVVVHGTTEVLTTGVFGLRDSLNDIPTNSTGFHLDNFSGPTDEFAVVTAPQRSSSVCVMNG